MSTLTANYPLIYNLFSFQRELSRLDSVGEKQKPALDQDCCSCPQGDSGALYAMDQHLPVGRQIFCSKWY